MYFLLFPRPKIKQLLEKGTLVIVDRYAFSGVAFTAAKVGTCFKNLPRFTDVLLRLILFSFIHIFETYPYVNNF